MTKVLIVGAGALGQVFGAWLAAGGARVSYLVRPGREGWEGASLYRLRRGRAPVAERVTPYEVRSEPPRERWDMVWLCVDSPALRGDWTGALRAATGEATVVTIGQDPGDLRTLAGVWPREQIVQVTPTLLAYQAPLEREVPAPGVAYWVPPGTATGVTGARAPQVVAALRAGGVRARRVTRAGAGELTAARMIPYIAALESAGWRLPASGPRLRGAAAAVREAVAVVCAQHGLRAPVPVPSWAVGLALRVLPRLLPFDLRRYLETHFTKVSAQTRLMLDGWIAEGSARALPVGRLSAVRDSLPA
ncbi:ketopantoate reductase family protein [Nonomuraea sp. NPDC049655]|uniref:ketopantoate reductase family protein n=1 Tax=Nonomuraea sp. NPDC049655 TaxID=3364355 RepID=UPI00378E6480